MRVPSIPKPSRKPTLVLNYPITREIRPKTARVDHTSLKFDVLTYQPVLKGRGKLSFSGIDEPSVCESTRAAHTTRDLFPSKCPQFDSVRHIVRSFPSDFNKENLSKPTKLPSKVVDPPKKPPLRASEKAKNPVSVLPFIRNSYDIDRFYQRLEELEQKLEADKKERGKIRIPEGMFSEEEVPA